MKSVTFALVFAKATNLLPNFFLINIKRQHFKKYFFYSITFYLVFLFFLLHLRIVAATATSGVVATRIHGTNSNLGIAATLYDSKQSRDSTGCLKVMTVGDLQNDLVD